MASLSCIDLGPFACVEAGCPAPRLSCYALANRLSACDSTFGDIWQNVMPEGSEPHERISESCAASCRRCSADQLRATVVTTEPKAWPWPAALQHVDSVFATNISAAALADRIAASTTAGPLIIRQAFGDHFRPAAWSRSALRTRCAPTSPPSPPWPTIAYREPAVIGKRWAGLHFDNGAAQGYV